jgi:hypothetical protein
MNDTTTTPAPPGRQAAKGGRIAAIVASGLIGLVSLGFLATGGLLLWGDSQKDADGYLSTRTEPYTTATSALATENLDLDLDGAGSLVDDDIYGKVRLRAQSEDAKPVFIGIARTSDVNDYLRGTSHELIEDVDYPSFEAHYSRQPGTATPAAPASRHIWAASAQGQGKQSLTWDVKDGDWSVVVMNADGSPGVHAGVSAGASLGFLDDAGRIAITTGVVLLILAGGLLYIGIRPRRGGGAAQPRPEEPNPLEPRSVADSSSTISISGAQYGTSSS